MSLSIFVALERMFRANIRPRKNPRRSQSHSRLSRPLTVEPLENRLLLSGNHPTVIAEAAGPLEHHVEGTNWIDPSLPKGHNKHIDHTSWDSDPTTDATVTVVVLVHNHGNLDTDELARIDDAIAEVNSAAVNFGVNLNLVKVSDTNQFHNIHVHEDTTSGCGAAALGCAEYAVYINHSGKFGDGHGNHLYAGEEVRDIGGRAEATLLGGYNWYTGTDPSLIGSNQYDYQTVATQELLHLVGLDHDDTVHDSDNETIDNTDRRSVMHGSLAPGIVRPFMSTHDQEVLQHVYGPGQAADEGGGGGGDSKGPPKGKGKNKSASSAVADGIAVAPSGGNTSQVARDERAEAAAPDDNKSDVELIVQSSILPSEQTIDSAISALIPASVQLQDDTDEAQEEDPLKDLGGLLLPLTF